MVVRINGKRLNFYLFSAIFSATLFGCGDTKKTHRPVDRSTTDNLSAEKQSEPIGDAHNPTPTPDQTNSEKGRALRTSDTGVGIKNYLQINASFAALTGVDPNLAAVAASYAEVQGSLPGNNDIKLFSSTIQNSIGKLAAEYCRAMASDQALRTNIVPGFNFGANVATSLDAVGTDALVNGLVDSFWRGLGLSNDKESMEMLKSLTDDIKRGVNQNNTGTIAVATGVCTAVLSSSAVVLI
jgi:hypothetical protein